MSDNKRRMEAYFYSFQSTSADCVNKILSAVAWAGKAFHHTQDWGDEAGEREDHTGSSPVDWIQNAAKEAADQIESDAKRIAELEADQTKLTVLVDELRHQIAKSEAEVKGLRDENRSLRFAFKAAEIGDPPSCSGCGLMAGACDRYPNCEGATALNKEYWMIEKSINGHAHWWISDKSGSTHWDDPKRWTADSSKANHYESKGDADYVMGDQMVGCVSTAHINCDRPIAATQEQGK